MSARVDEKSMLASAAGASLRHTASGCACTSSFVRPLRTDCGNCSASHPVTACSSLLVEDEPLLLAAAVLAAADQHEAAVQLLAVQVDVELAVGDGLHRIVGVHRLRRCPSPRRSRRRRRTRRAGITPSKSKYSIGWSSTCTPSRFTFGSSDGPFGIAQLTSTPSISSRKS